MALSEGRKIFRDLVYDRRAKNAKHFIEQSSSNQVQACFPLEAGSCHIWREVRPVLPRPSVFYGVGGAGDGERVFVSDGRGFYHRKTRD